jgi:hypothetical protein
MDEKSELKARLDSEAATVNVITNPTVLERAYKRAAELGQPYKANNAAQPVAPTNAPAKQ